MVTLCSDLCLEFAGQSCGTTVTVRSVSMDKRSCFRAGRLVVGAFRFLLSNGGLSKKKRNLEERGERENELTNSKSFVCRVFLSPSVRRGTAKERERERKRKGGAREDLWTGSTPMHLPTPFASSCSLVAGNYRRGNFWYDSNDGKGSLLDLDAFFLPFLFFCFFLFFFRPWPSLHTAWFGRVNRLTRLRIINSNQRAKMLNLSTLSFFLTLVSTFPPMLFETF